jgi:phage terminase large subunit GpA-like protein
LTEHLNRPVEHASGALLRVDAALIDMLGHRTEAVKAFVRSQRVRRLVAGFGATANSAPALGKGRLHDVNWRGQMDKRGVLAYPVGTVAIKHMLYGWLSSDSDKTAEARRVRFSDQLDDRYFGGLTSETYNPTKNRFEKRRGGPRNEPLDTWVYGYAAALHPELRMHRWTKAQWDAREAQVLGGGTMPVVSRETKTQTSGQKPSAVSRETSRRGRGMVDGDWGF